MSVPSKWRQHARKALENYFSKRSYPRAILSLIILITGLAGYIISFAMLRAGLTDMWLRYPLAVLGAYAVLLGLVRVWVEIEKARFDPAVIATIKREREEFLPTHQKSTSSPWLDIPSGLDVPDFEEGCLVAILIGAVVALAVVVVTTIVGAPLLIAEVFFDAFIVSVIYRRLRLAQKEHWLGTALRKTWKAAIILALSLSSIGFVLQQMAPGAPSIGKAIEQIRLGKG